MFEDFLYDYNWLGFGIAFVLLAVLPVWAISIFEMSFFTKLLATLILGVITFIAVGTGGAKRGMLFK